MYITYYDLQGEEYIVECQHIVIPEDSLTLQASHPKLIKGTLFVDLEKIMSMTITEKHPDTYSGYRDKEDK